METEDGLLSSVELALWLLRLEVDAFRKAALLEVCGGANVLLEPCRDAVAFKPVATEVEGVSVDMDGAAVLVRLLRNELAFFSEFELAVAAFPLLV